MNDTDNAGKDSGVSKELLKHITPPPLGEGLRERAQRAYFFFHHSWKLFLAKTGFSWPMPQGLRLE